MIVGVGNLDRGDDGIGAWAVEELRRRGIDASSCRGETTELMDLWTGLDHVVVIDAMRSGAAPGTVLRLDAGDGPFPTQAFTGSTHNFGLAEAIELSRALGLLPATLVVYGIEGACFDAGAPISASVLNAAKNLIEELIHA